MTRHPWAESYQTCIDQWSRCLKQDGASPKRRANHLLELHRYLILTYWPLRPDDNRMGVSSIIRRIKGDPTGTMVLLMNRKDADDIVELHNSRYEPKIDWW